MPLPVTALAMPRLSVDPAFDWHYLCKFILIGDSSVGKSALLLRVTDDRFLAEEAEPTVGVEFGSVTIALTDGQKAAAALHPSSSSADARRETSSSDHGPAAGSSSTPAKTAPPCFQRSPPKDLSYTPFVPLALYTIDTALNKGFPRMPPIAVVEPHPFSVHDVREDDWYWFLSAVKGAAAAAGTDFTSIPGVAPVATHLALSMGT